MNLYERMMSFFMAFVCFVSLQLVGSFKSTWSEAIKGPEMILVSGGTFMMGDVFENPKQMMLPETPIHEVQLDNFYMSKYEITVGDFKKFIRSRNYVTLKEEELKIKFEKNEKPYDTFTWKKPGFNSADNFPVVWIAWEDAAAYCNWLSEMHGYPIAYDLTDGRLLDEDGKPTDQIHKVKGYRLPTEAEWEYAAREKGKKVLYGNGKNEAVEGEIQCVFIDKPISKEERDNMKTTPVEVGSFAPNALGLHDMSGNAWEWCCDQGKEYTEGKKINPYNYGIDHALRGGTYDSKLFECNVYGRINFWKGAKCGASGFRIVRSSYPFTAYKSN